MVDIDNSQRSFNNSWALHDRGAVPAGVILDIAVVTPLSGHVRIAKLTAELGYLSMSLKQGDTEIAYMRTAEVGTTVKLDSDVPGVCAVAVFGYIPDNLSFIGDSTDCILSPEVVLHTNYRHLNTPAAKSMIIWGDEADRNTAAVSGPVDIVISPELSASISDGVLRVDVADSSYLDSAAGQANADGFVTSVNGVPCNKEGVVELTISSTERSVNVASYTECVAVIDIPELPACSIIDNIDDYIRPTSGECKPLDICYNNDGRDSAQLLQIRYGMNSDLNIDSIDPDFDHK